MLTTPTSQIFVAKWRKIALKGSAATKEHFLDLCRLLDHSTPTHHFDGSLLARLLALNLARAGGS